MSRQIETIHQTFLRTHTAVPRITGTKQQAAPRRLASDAEDQTTGGGYLLRG